VPFLYLPDPACVAVVGSVFSLQMRLPSFARLDSRGGCPRGFLLKTDDRRLKVHLIHLRHCVPRRDFHLWLR